VWKGNGPGPSEQHQQSLFRKFQTPPSPFTKVCEPQVHCSMQKLGAQGVAACPENETASHIAK